MLRIIILAALSCAAFGQPAPPTAPPIQVIYKPLPLSSTALSLGKGRQAAVWTVSVCAGAPATIPRQRIMMAAPAIHDIPNRQAEDLLIRRAAKQSWWAHNGDALLGLGASALTTSGLVTRNNATAYVGLGITLVQVVLGQVKRDAPDPRIYVVDLLPDAITLGAGACGTWLVVAGLTKNPETIGPVNIPMAIQAAAQGMTFTGAITPAAAPAAQAVIP